MSQNDGFSVITSISRNVNIENLINNFNIQNFKNKELIVIINKDEIEISEFDKYLNKDGNIRIFKLPQEVNLGECLNFGVRKSKHNFIAKFDDDDYYTKFYLDEMYKAMIETGCNVVGKADFLFYLAGKKTLVEHPKKSRRDMRMHKANDYVKWIAGATICFRKTIFDIVQFADINSCIDNVFMEDCVANNIKAYSTSPYNFIAYRNINKDIHTWKVTDEGLMESCDIIKENLNLEEACEIVIKEI